MRRRAGVVVAIATGVVVVEAVGVMVTIGVVVEAVSVMATIAVEAAVVATAMARTGVRPIARVASARSHQPVPRRHGFVRREAIARQRLTHCPRRNTNWPRKSCEAVCPAFVRPSTR